MTLAEACRRLSTRIARPLGEEGSAIVLVATCIVFLVAFLALSLDAGRAYVLKEHLQQAVDAAAVDGARYLPEAPATAVETAQAIAADNGVPAADVTPVVTGGGLELDVTASEPLNFLFAPLLGIRQAVVSASAGARVGEPEVMTGLIPLGVYQQTFVPGETYTLKAGSGGGTDGDYGALWFGDGNPGADTYEADLEQGCPLAIHVGDTVSTKPGDMVGPTDQGLQQRMSEGGDTVSVDNPRLVYVPIVTRPSGGRTTVTVVGFAAFFLESVQDGQVTGMFLQETVNGPAGPLSSGDFGLKAVQLVY